MPLISCCFSHKPHALLGKLPNTKHSQNRLAAQPGVRRKASAASSSHLPVVRTITTTSICWSPWPSPQIPPISPLPLYKVPGTPALPPPDPLREHHHHHISRDFKRTRDSRSLQLYALCPANSLPSTGTPHPHRCTKRWASSIIVSPKHCIPLPFVVSGPAPSTDSRRYWVHGASPVFNKIRPNFASRRKAISSSLSFVAFAILAHRHSPQRSRFSLLHPRRPLIRKHVLLRDARCTPSLKEPPLPGLVGHPTCICTGICLRLSPPNSSPTLDRNLIRSRTGIILSHRITPARPQHHCRHHRITAVRGSRENELLT